MHMLDQGRSLCSGRMNVSKWFYDTYTGTATGAAHCDSFVGKGFSLLVVS
jgi:hypothetical protein